MKDEIRAPIFKFNEPGYADLKTFAILTERPTTISIRDFNTGVFL